jgi:hypothetical protein
MFFCHRFTDDIFFLICESVAIILRIPWDLRFVKSPDFVPVTVGNI